MACGTGTDQVSWRWPRRRLLLAIGALTGVGNLAGSVAAPAPPAWRWRGSALGAAAALTLYHDDQAAVHCLIAQIMAEIERLERIFSLQRGDSELVRLNQSGELAAPSLDLVQLLRRASWFGACSHGVFDVTVQPLWRLHAEHFARPGSDPAGPPPALVVRVRALVDYRQIEVTAEHIRFARPGMAVTLNGIAQGYIADRVAALLQRQGVRHALVSIGETRAVGPPADEGAWRIGLNRSEVSERGRSLVLAGGALASTDPAGFYFDHGRRAHHLLDPRTGRSCERARPVNIVAADATTADALSTACAMLSPAAAHALCRAHGDASEV